MGKAKISVKAFIDAAINGDAARLRELLAAGIPVASLDHTGQNALQHATSRGHIEATQVLLDAGADVHQMAVGGGNLIHGAAFLDTPDMVRLLIARGVDVNVPDRSGFTALMAAAYEGNVEMAKVLLAAGADREARGSFGISLKKLTALEWAQRERKKKVAELLAADASPTTEDPAYAAFARFADSAAQPAFQEVLQHLATLARKKPVAWKKCKGVYHTVLKATQDVDGILDDFRARGFLLVLSEPWAEGEATSVMLFPTADKYAVLLACQTNGDNYGHSTHDVIVWLRELEKDHPFVLTSAGEPLVGGRFLQPIADAVKLARRMIAFCPDLLDGEIMTSAKDVARDLAHDQGFVLWWD